MSFDRTVFARCNKKVDQNHKAEELTERDLWKMFGQENVVDLLTAAKGSENFGWFGVYSKHQEVYVWISEESVRQDGATDQILHAHIRLILI